MNELVNLVLVKVSWRSVLRYMIFVNSCLVKTFAMEKPSGKKIPERRKKSTTYYDLKCTSVASLKTFTKKNPVGKNIVKGKECNIQFVGDILQDAPPNPFLPLID